MSNNRANVGVYSVTWFSSLITTSTLNIDSSHIGEFFWGVGLAAFSSMCLGLFNWAVLFWDGLVGCQASCLRLSTAFNSDSTSSAHDRACFGVVFLFCSMAFPLSTSNFSNFPGIQPDLQFSSFRPYLNCILADCLVRNRKLVLAHSIQRTKKSRRESSVDQCREMNCKIALILIDVSLNWEY